MSNINDYLRNVKEHPEFPGYYITEDGTIFSLRILNGNTGQRDGYLRVTLRKDNEDCQKLTHRLVAETYIPNPDNKPQVNHKDRDRTNNSVSNLEWVTPRENSEHASAKHYRVQNIATKEVLEVFNLNRWCEEMALTPSGMYQTLSGRAKQHKGWKLLHSI